ncbi:MAG: hypothetical protein M5R36_20010 [Deltaproteobacteria bacterium]|nr:hypothetical protein [Deltaproteobacteria bacterium]
MTGFRPVELVAVVGATCTGKTRLAARVAARLDSEVISADSRQVYRGMDLGTGKDRGDFVADGRAVPIRLIDLLDPEEDYSVFDFHRDFRAAFRDARARGKFPVLAGGTNLYVARRSRDTRWPRRRATTNCARALRTFRWKKSSRNCASGAPTCITRPT